MVVAAGHVELRHHANPALAQALQLEAEGDVAVLVGEGYARFSAGAVDLVTRLEPDLVCMSVWSTYFELAGRLMSPPILAVTGTNGKPITLVGTRPRSGWISSW